MDYSKILDGEVLSFLKKADSFQPANPDDPSVADYRDCYDRMCAAFDVGRPDGVETADIPYGGVPCRVYNTGGSEGTVLFCHGGGFILGGLDSHDSICAEFCGSAGMRVVSVDYRLSPEHPHPHDFNDAVAAFDAVRSAHPGPIVLAGDSAGGNLVAAVAHARRGQASGCLLIYPGLGGDWSLPSYIEHAEAPGLTTRDMQFYQHMRTGGADKSGDATYAPLQDTDFSNLPPTVAITAQCDPLSSDGDEYVRQLKAAGVPAIWREEQGLVHAYLRARHMSAKASASFARMIAALAGLRDGRLPEF